MDVNHICNIIKTDPVVASEFKVDPEAALRKYGSPLKTDKWIYRTAVGVLGACGLVTTVGVLVVWGMSPPENFRVPEVLIALGSASIGALAGLLAMKD